MAHVTPFDTTLSNGLRVVICPDSSSPVVNVTVMYRVGSHDEHRGKTGLAHLFEHLMFDNATPGVDKQYDLYCTKAGGSNNAYTTFDYTTYHIDVPSHNLELGLWLESERMRAFRITDHALQTQRSVVVEEINQNVFNQPYGIWRKVQQEVAYESTSSYSWDVYGSPDDVAGVTMDDARTFFETYYHPSNAVLCIAGDTTPEQAMPIVEQLFGSITSEKPTIHRTPFNTEMIKKGTSRIQEDNVPMTALFLSVHVAGFSTNELLDSEIASTIIGSGRSSLLYKKLVSDLRIASSVSCFVDRRANDSLFTIYAHASDESVSGDQLYNGIQQALTTAVLDQSHVDSAINKIKTGHAAELQKAHGVADVVAWTTLFWDNPTYVNIALDRYATVTLHDVQTLIGKCTTPNEQIRLDIVPKK